MSPFPFDALTNLASDQSGHFLVQAFNASVATSKQWDARNDEAFEWISKYWTVVIAWLSQPHVLAIITAWWITFTIVITLLACAGFGPVGIIGGSWAAVFQAWAYGGFTPAGGIFATLTSIAMTGMLAPAIAIAGVVIATLAAIAVGCSGAGR